MISNQDMDAMDITLLNRVFKGLSRTLSRGCTRDVQQIAAERIAAERNIFVHGSVTDPLFLKPDFELSAEEFDVVCKTLMQALQQLLDEPGQESCAAQISDAFSWISNGTATAIALPSTSTV